VQVLIVLRVLALLPYVLLATLVFSKRHLYQALV